jgi:hypothetical protein
MMLPEEVGAPEDDMVLGKKSGRHPMTDRVTELSDHPADERLEAPFHEFTMPAHDRAVHFRLAHDLDGRSSRGGDR